MNDEFVVNDTNKSCRGCGKIVFHYVEVDTLIFFLKLKVKLHGFAHPMQKPLQTGSFISFVCD